MDIHTVTGTKEEQIAIEEMKKEEGVNKFLAQMRSAIAQGRFSETPYGSVLLRLGFDVYRDKLNEYFDTEIKGNRHVKQRNLLLLITDDVDVLAYEVLTTVINYSTTNNNSITQLSTVLMNKLFDNYVYGRLKIDSPKLHTYLGYEFRRATKRKRIELVKRNIKSLYNEYSPPEAALRLQVGTLLINLLELSGANIIKTTRTVISNTPLRTSFMVSFTEEAQEVMSSLDGEELAKNAIEKLPLIVPPRDWVSVNKGGYYTSRDRLLSHGVSPTVKEFQEVQSYKEVYPIVNKLQHTPWRVNHKMLDIVETVFTKNLPIGKLPSSTVRTWKDFMTMPEYDEKNKEVWVEANKRRQQIQIDLDIEFSKRLMLIFALSTAKTMVKYKQFYYSYSLDYRGRIYPTSTHLNLLGTSEIKSLIEFGEGQYLTADGMRWLKIHIANVYGLDKEPYDDRVAWVDEHYDDIMKISKDALAHTELWGDADSPFEYVAACMAFSDALNGEMVYLPIQLDATCSGIQMYSGLLRDKVGAKSVNVIGAKRNDIYQQVADGVEYKLLHNEYDNIVSYTDSEGKLHSTLTDATARSLRGNVSRKIVKRPTMTVPYSVTMRGMRDQIDDELLTLENAGKAFWVGERWIANRLLTSLTSASIYSILDGAKKGQEYLVKLSRTLDGPAVWYSPIYNFPVHQNTIERKRKEVATVYGRLILQIEGDKHNRRRQANQIAPNFIHSIDSTILMGVIDEVVCHIGTIHDCFLVPPNNGYEVQEAYKKSYVEVMESDPLRQIQQRLDPLETVEFPEYGDLNLNDVYDAQYIIS